MTTNKHDFEELAAPKAAAKELGISCGHVKKIFFNRGKGYGQFKLFCSD